MVEEVEVDQGGGGSWTTRCRGEWSLSYVSVWSTRKDKIAQDAGKSIARRSVNRVLSVVNNRRAGGPSSAKVKCVPATEEALALGQIPSERYHGRVGVRLSPSPRAGWAGRDGGLTRAEELAGALWRAVRPRVTHSTAAAERSTA